MYFNEYNKVKSSTVTAGYMMWVRPIWLRFIRLWWNPLEANLINGI